ncbi:MAG: C1 family peptidase [Bacteroidetes bacterium]|jgi:bleomycin hydrolase|nr:C1 family peptidase [Bacteroidota bacterium]MBT4337650.1 C1 family peptidase [Bacteroidota bacterium]MBT7828183.1 C1 family peptidase [Bacteroidota bacterium]
MKTRKSLLAICLTILGIASFAQQKGAITETLINDFQKSVQNTNIEALQNAVSNNAINKLAINQSSKSSLDFNFKYKVITNGISDQKSSGRCWLYTGLNTLKPVILGNSNLSSFDFSHTFNFFWDQLEKSNLFLEGIIATRDKALNDRTVDWLFKNPIGDGGQWTTFADIVQKYGVVPQSAMPETHSSENTRHMSSFIKLKLKEDALDLRDMHAAGKNEDDIRTAKNNMLKDIYKILVINLGEPPTEFDWRYKNNEGILSDFKTYTPKSFYAEFFGVDLANYVMFMNDPTRAYHKVYEIEYDRNMIEGYNWKYINLPAADLKKMALTSLKNNEGMYFSCDVGKFLDSKNGTLDVDNYNYNALFDVEFGMDKKERIQTYSSGSSHGMALIGVDVDEKENTTKWLLENSWGAASGYKGHLVMTDEWFNEYMFRLVVNKEYIPAKILKILKEEATLLPPWDPMFAPEE